MNKILAAAALLGLVACSHPKAAVAAVSIHQTCAVSQSTGNCVFSSSPSNGDKVTCALAGNLNHSGAPYVKDSNGVSLTSQLTETGGANISDYTVSGSPTGTYATQPAGGGSGGGFCLDLTGVTQTPQYEGCTSASATSCTPTAVSIFTNDVQIMVGGGNGNAFTSITCTNGSYSTVTFTSDGEYNFEDGGTATATSSASSSCTFTQSTAGAVQFVWADYSAGASTTAVAGWIGG